MEPECFHSFSFDAISKLVELLERYGRCSRGNESCVLGSAKIPMTRESPRRDANAVDCNTVLISAEKEKLGKQN